MTIIAWDGRTLAADQLNVNGNTPFLVCKIFRLPDNAIAGYAGDQVQCEEMRAWLEGGARVQDFPISQRDKERWAAVLKVRANGEVLKYENAPYPICYLPGQKIAIGSGRDFALMAMHLGKTAKEAVELTSLFDIAVGGGVDTLTLGV